MIRLLVQLDAATHRKLRERAFRQERSVSSVVREMVEKGLDGDSRKRPTRLKHFASVGAGRSRQGRLSPISEKHDEALAAALEK